MILTEARLSHETANESVSTRIAALEGATQQAEAAQRALDLANSALQGATLDDTTADGLVEARISELDEAATQARAAQRALELANSELQEAAMADTSADAAVLARQSELEAATTLRDELPTVEEAQDILDRVQARVVEL